MGKSTKTKYVVQVNAPGNSFTTAWSVSNHGKATVENLKNFVFSYAKSLLIGGANAHLSTSKSGMPLPTSALIRINAIHGRVVAEWKAEPFEVFF